MAENSSKIGDKLIIEIYGASHAEKIGIKIYGFPKNITVDFDNIKIQMTRRAPGNIAYSTARKEPDIPQIICGVENGVTTGEMIEAVIYNTNQHSSDYDELKFTPRPGHADYTAYAKYNGTLDMSGGGKFSARLTAPLVFAGALCKQLLNQQGVIIASHVSSIGNITDDKIDPVSPNDELLTSLSLTPFPVVNEDKKQEMIKLMSEMRAELDSVGGTVECFAAHLPVGLGDSLFDGLEGKLSSYIFGIPAVKGLQFGIGFDACELNGSENNDEFCIDNGKVKTKTNNCGGILGGITNGMPLYFKVAFKPTPSIAKEQNSVNLQTMTEQTIAIKGRHDPCVVPRGAAVVEAATAIALCDIMLSENKL